MKTYTVTGAQLRSILKNAFWQGFDAERTVQAADAWEESEMRKQIDYGAYLEDLEDAAKTLVTK